MNSTIELTMIPKEDFMNIFESWVVIIPKRYRPLALRVFLRYIDEAEELEQIELEEILREVEKDVDEKKEEDKEKRKEYRRKRTERIAQVI